MSLIDQLHQKKTWRPNTGDEMLISEMTTQHIQNTVAFLWRRREDLKMAEEAYYALGPKPTGEAASDDFDADFEQLLQTPANWWFRELPLIDAFRRELINRGESASWLIPLDQRSSPTE